MRNIGKQLHSTCVGCIQWGGQGWSGYEISHVLCRKCSAVFYSRLIYGHMYILLNRKYPTEQIFTKFDIRVFRKSVEKIQVSIKSDKNNGHFTGRQWTFIMISR